MEIVQNRDHKVKLQVIIWMRYTVIQNGYNYLTWASQEAQLCSQGRRSKRLQSEIRIIVILLSCPDSGSISPPNSVLPSLNHRICVLDIHPVMRVSQLTQITTNTVKMYWLVIEIHTVKVRDEKPVYMFLKDFIYSRQ